MTTELTTGLVTPKHQSISLDFIEKIMEMLKSGPQLTNYKVGESWNNQEEAIRVKVNDKTTIDISLTVSK